MASRSLKDYQRSIDDWAQTLETPYWAPLSIFARLVEETGELGRLLNHLYGDKPKKTTEARQELGEEMADIMFALLCLANREGVDLDTAMEKVIDKARTRDRNRFQKKQKPK